MKTPKEPKVKLTLSVKKSAIDHAKKYAVREGASLSSIVEDYLLSYPASVTEKAVKEASIADQLFGCASGGPLSKMTDKEIKDLMIKDKYGL